MLTGAGLIRVADAQSTPVISAGGVTNAAAAKTILARGGLATIYGSNFTSSASTTFQAQMTPFPLVLGGVSVTVGGATAPLYYVSSTQINFQTPFQVPAGASVNVVVTVNNVASAPATVAIADYAVAVFGYFRTASAYDPIIVHSLDNSLVTPANPAVPNETLVVYATGIGKLTNAPASGAVAPGPPLLAQAADTPAATVGGSAAQVIFAGLTPGSVGLAQFDITLPANIASGSLPLVIQFPGDSSPLVNLAVKGNIQGTPLLTLSPASLAYGNVTVGQASDLTVNVINTGSATLTVNSINASAGFSVVSPATPVNVAPGATQTIDVRFAPSGAGPISGTLSIASNAAGSPVSVSLSGTGVAAVAPGISLSASSLSFGTVASGQASSQSVTINNSGQRRADRQFDHDHRALQRGLATHSFHRRRGRVVDGDGAVRAHRHESIHGHAQHRKQRGGITRQRRLVRHRNAGGFAGVRVYAGTGYRREMARVGRVERRAGLPHRQ